MDLGEFDAHRATVSTDRGEIAYADVGSGPPALFVHGVFMNGALWRNAIEGVKDFRRCIAVDLPAHGRTPLSPKHDLSLRGHAELLEAVCEALDLDRIDLVGNDTGGAVAQIFAARNPAFVRTLTLTNTDAHDNVPPQAFNQGMELAQRGELAPVLMQLATNTELARANPGLLMGYEDPDRVPEELILSYMGRFANEEDAREVERMVCATGPDDLLGVEPALRKLEAPTLIVWGTGDIFFEVDWAYWLRDLIPGAQKVVEVKGGKLFFVDERADELVPHLRAHWEAHAPAEVRA